MLESLSKPAVSNLQILHVRCTSASNLCIQDLGLGMVSVEVFFSHCAKKPEHLRRSGDTCSALPGSAYLYSLVIHIDDRSNSNEPRVPSVHRFKSHARQKTVGRPLKRHESKSQQNPTAQTRHACFLKCNFSDFAFRPFIQLEFRLKGT